MCPELKILEKCSTKTIQGAIVFCTTRNRPKILTFVKYFSKIFDIVFLIAYGRPSCLTVQTAPSLEDDLLITKLLVLIYQYEKPV